MPFVLKSRFPIAVLFSALSLGAAQAEERQLKGAEIVPMLTGSTYKLVRPKIDRDIRHVYKPDGKIDYVVDGVANPGAWLIQNEQMCWQFAGMNTPDCWDVFVDGQTLRLFGMVQWVLEKAE
jgi:hypothetical protein